jgi:hypothetical protein
MLYLNEPLSIVFLKAFSHNPTFSFLFQKKKKMRNIFPSNIFPYSFRKVHSIKLSTLISFVKIYIYIYIYICFLSGLRDKRREKLLNQILIYYIRVINFHQSG